MSSSGIKPIITLTGSSFYQKIMEKYQTGKKNTSGFPSMIFYKEKRFVFPQNINMILKFSLHLNKQNILPLLISKNVSNIRGRLPRLKTEKKALEPALKLKYIQSTNYVTKIFLTALKIPQEPSVASEHFPAGNASTNNIKVFSFLKSLIPKSENTTNNSSTILKSSFFPVNHAFYCQKTSTIYPDILALNPKTGRVYELLINSEKASMFTVFKKYIERFLPFGISPAHAHDPKILNYENNMEILNLQKIGKKTYFRLLNFAKIPTFNYKENKLKYWHMFEDKSPWNYLGQQNISSTLTVKNIPVIKEVIPWLNTEKNSLQSIVKQKGAQNKSDITNLYVSQVALKTPQGSSVASEHFLAGSTSTNNITVFSFLRSLIPRYKYTTNNSSTILKSSFFPVNYAFYCQKTSTIFPDILALNPKIGRVYELLINSEKASMFTVFKKHIERFLPFGISPTHAHDPKILNYENNMEILNLQIIGKKKYFRLLNFAKIPTFNYRENKLNYWPVFEDKSPWNYLGQENISSTLTVKNIPVIKEVIPWLNTEKNSLQSMVKQKGAQNKSDITNISQAALKILRMYHVASGILSTGRTFISKISTSSFIKPLIFKAENIVTYSNKELKPLTLSGNSTYYQQAINLTYSGVKQASFLILNYKNNKKILNSKVFRIKNNYGSLNTTNHSAFINQNNTVNQLISENKLPAVFLQDNLLFNKTRDMNRLFLKESKWETVSKRFVKNNYGNFEYEAPSSVLSKHNYKTKYQSLIFQDQSRIEQEIEQIKKTLIETKKYVSEKTVPAFGEADIKKYLDINRISSQVYQNIERTIRMERERRGV